MASSYYGTLPPQLPDFHGHSQAGSGSLPPQPVTSDHSIFRSGSTPKKQSGRPVSRLHVVELIVLPWMLLVLVLGTYFVAGTHGEAWVLWVIPAVLLLLVGAFIRWHYKAANNADAVLGILCMTSIVIGLIVGVYAELSSLQEFARISNGASYANVLPSEIALGKDDATTLEFTNLTTIDGSRSYGFIQVLPASVHTHCVAPIGTPEQGVGRRIQYFAAGLDCCGLQGNFNCGEAGNVNAHGGIVIRDAGGYAEAIRGAEAMYGFKAADGYLLVEWAQDPIVYSHNLWIRTGVLFLIFAGVYLVISVMMGIALMPFVSAPASGPSS